ncbi:MAG: Gfo/Idh/MocA family oxidoreductase [Alphaproteobacteria bacterium]
MDSDLRLAIVGYGRMGQFHNQALQQSDSFKVVAIVEPDESKHSDIEQHYGCSVFSSVESLNCPVDCVTITSPSPTHYSLAKHFLEQGIPCLIEKPLSIHAAEVADLVAIANTVPILVGHSERYNPTFLALQEAVRGQELISIAARRLNYDSSRIVDTDVIMDLMIHDIDLILTLTNKPVTDLHGTFIRDDHCDALLHFEDGTLANITASRITPCRLRELTVTTATGFYRADLLNQHLSVQSPGQKEANALPIKQQAQALTMQYQHFCDIVRQRVEPQVSAAAAQQSLNLVWRLQALKTHHAHILKL